MFTIFAVMVFIASGYAWPANFLPYVIGLPGMAITMILIGVDVRNFKDADTDHAWYSERDRLRTVEVRLAQTAVCHRHRAGRHRRELPEQGMVPMGMGIRVALLIFLRGGILIPIVLIITILGTLLAKSCRGWAVRPRPGFVTDTRSKAPRTRKDSARATCAA